MNYILFHATAYNGDPKTEGLVFQGFSNALDKLKPKSESTKRLGPYSWLFDRENDISMFAAVVAEAEAAHLKYTVIFLSSEN